MSHYIKPATDKKLQKVILACRTNNLAYDVPNKIVSENISMKNNFKENIPSVDMRLYLKMTLK